MSDKTPCRPKTLISGAYHPFLPYDITDRLCWSVLDDVSDIQIADDLNDPSSTRQLLADHPLAMEPLINVNFRQKITLLEVSVYILQARDGDRLGLADEYASPELSIELQENEPITLGEFVRKVHEFVQDHQDELVEASIEAYGKEPVPGTRYIFRAFNAPIVALEEGWAHVTLDFVRNDPGGEQMNYYNM